MGFVTLTSFWVMGGLLLLGRCKPFCRSYIFILMFCFTLFVIVLLLGCFLVSLTGLVHSRLLCVFELILCVSGRLGFDCELLLMPTVGVDALVLTTTTRSDDDKPKPHMFDMGLLDEAATIVGA